MASPAEMDDVKGSGDVEPSVLGPDSALLVVIGEPFSAEQRELILEKITKELKTWDVTVGCDINSELEAVATQAPVGEDGPNGEKQVQQVSDCLHLEVLVNPQSQTLRNKLRSFLLLQSRYRHVVYAGQVVQGAGSWILQDDLFTLANFLSVCKEADVENAIKQLPTGSVFNISTLSEGDWSAAALAKQSLAKSVQVNLNPEEKVQEFNGLIQFTAYLSYFIKVRSMKELLAASDVVGNIRFSRPTLYIFPGAQGDSSLFGISGFNLLVNGGYSRKACFWDFTRHLDRIDAVILTHLGYDNMFGLGAVLERKVQENVHPEVGYVYFNAVEGTKHSPNGDAQPENGGVHKTASLTVSLIEEGNKLVENMKQLGQGPHPCSGQADKTGLHPINLYHKVGHGSLDMYILNPLQDNKELKDFLVQWNKNVKSFSGKGFPLPNACSMCALLVWRPAADVDNITRILFPGNVPQQKVFEGLDKLKNLNILQHPVCSERSLHAPKSAVAKKAGATPAAKPPRSSGRSTPPQTPRPSEAKVEPRKAIVEKKPPPAKAPAASKPAKDIKNKKAGAKPAEKKSPTSSAASTDTAKTSSPAETPKPSSTPSNTPTDRSSPPPPETSAGVLEAAIPKAAEEISQKAPTVESIVEDAVQTPVVMDDPTPPVPGAVMDEEPAPVPPAQPIEEPAPGPDVKSEPLEVPTGNLLDSTELPEADQQPDSQPEPEAVQSEPMDVPEPLPDPSQFDNATFEAIANSVQAKALEEAGVLESEVKQEAIEAEKPPVIKTEPEVQAPVEEVETPAVQAEPADEVEPPSVEAEPPFVKEEPVVEAEPPVTENEPPVEEEKLPVEPSVVKDEPPEDIEPPVEEAAPPVLKSEVDEGAEDLVVKAEPVHSPFQEEPFQTEPKSFPEFEPLREPEPIQDSLPVSEPQPQSVSEPAVDAAEVEQVESSTLSPESEALPSQDMEAVQPDLLAETGAQEGGDSLEELGVYESQEDQQGKSLEELGIYDDDEGVVVEDAGGASEPTEMGQDDGHKNHGEYLPSPHRLVEDDADMEDDSLVEDLSKAQPQQDNRPDIVSDAGALSGGQVDLLGDFQHPSTEGFSLVDGPRDHEPLQPEAMQFPQTTNPFLLGDSNQAPSDPLAHSMSPFDLVSPQQEDLAHAPPQFAAPENQERDSLEREEASSSFDPLKEWGQPMGLPAPDNTTGKKVGSERKEGAAAEKKPPAAGAGKAGGAKRPGAAKPPSGGTAKKAPTKGALDKSVLDTSRAKPVNDENKNGTSKAKKPAAGATNPAAKKPGGRPSTAPTPTKAAAPSKSAGPGTKRAATATAGPKAESAPKAAPLKPVTPFYVDLTYIPNHGDSAYVDLEFFRKVRARYYVLSSVAPTAAVLNALLEAKATWENPDLEVTLIPTYDTDTLRHWMALHRDELSQHKIDVAPSASRCTIQLQDHETSCAAYRLEF